jgi:hypothetical protein
LVIAGAGAGNRGGAGAGNRGGAGAGNLGWRRCLAIVAAPVLAIEQAARNFGGGADRVGQSQLSATPLRWVIAADLAAGRAATTEAVLASSSSRGASSMGGLRRRQSRRRRRIWWRQSRRRLVVGRAAGEAGGKHHEHRKRYRELHNFEFTLAKTSRSYGDRNSVAYPVADGRVLTPDAQTKPTAGAKTFATPQDAANALIDAAEKYDETALKEILGPDSYDIVHTGEPARDSEKTKEFAAHARAKMSIEQNKTKTRATMIVGTEDWPFPVPIVKAGKSWFFDTKTGGREICCGGLDRTSWTRLRFVAAMSRPSMNMH